MNIKCENNDLYRLLSQLSWTIFGNDDVDIISEKIDNQIKTTVTFEGKTYVDFTEFTEKNDYKRSLYKAAKQIRDFDAPWGILTGVNPAKLAFDNFDKNQFMDKYFVADRQADLCEKVANFTKNTIVSPNDIAIYIGIPFCKTKCKYCSFVSNSIDTTGKYMTKYVDFLLQEIELTAKLIKNRNIRAIYIGGGTPTALDHKNFERLMSAVTTNFYTNNSIEFTVEAGRVDTIDDEKLRILKASKVTRISINPQVFDDEVLEKFNRNHTVKQTIEIYEKARNMNFDAINMDIIYGIGGDFSKTVDTLLDLNPENITIHTLAIKKGAAIDKNFMSNLGDINYFYDRIFKNFEPYYMYKQQYMIKPYENVGFFRDNTPCMYNVYMMENLMDIVALGSGSTSKIKKVSYFNNKYPLDYINNIEKVLKTKQSILNEV